MIDEDALLAHVRERSCFCNTAERALASGKPSIVEVVVDPFEPPMPSKVSVEQALHFAEALVKGQPAGGKITLTLFRDKLSELFK